MTEAEAKPPEREAPDRAEQAWGIFLLTAAIAGFVAIGGWLARAFKWLLANDDDE